MGQITILLPNSTKICFWQILTSYICPTMWCLTELMNLSLLKFYNLYYVQRYWNFSMTNSTCARFILKTSVTDHAIKLIPFKNYAFRTSEISPQEKKIDVRFLYICRCFVFWSHMCVLDLKYFLNSEFFFLNWNKFFCYSHKRNTCHFSLGR